MEAIVPGEVIGSIAIDSDDAQLTFDQLVQKA